MKVLVDSDGYLPLFKMVFENFKPTDDVSHHYTNKVYFVNASNVPKVGHPEKISDEWRHSFAITQSYEHEGTPVHLIVFNDKECTRLNLSDREKVAVVLHELGHILNRHPDLDSILTMRQCLEQEVNFEQEQKRKKYLCEMDEHFADQYPKNYGFKEELISCLEKSLLSKEYITQHSELKQRIKFINSNTDPLKGVIKPFHYV